MAEYILKFNEDCCPDNKVNYVNSWIFTAKPSSGAVITSIENTIFAGNVTDYIRIIGENLVDEHGDINGVLQVNTQCLDWCELSFWNNLFPVQIGGFGLVVPTPQRVLAFAGGNCVIGRGNQLIRVAPFALPLGQKVKIQLMGGIGNVRFVRIENPKVLAANAKILIEAPDFRPEMKKLAPNQVNAGIFTVDRDLGQGNHIVEVEATGIGRSLLTYTDEAGCFYVMAIDVKPNLCDEGDTISKEIDLEEGGRKGNVYKEDEIDQNDSDFDKEHAGFCHNCDLGVNDPNNPVAGNPFGEEIVQASLPIGVPYSTSTTEDFELIDNGNLGAGNVYQNDDFVRGTRSLDLEVLNGAGPVGLNKDFPVKMANIHEIKVGESKEIEMPNIGGRTRLTWQGDILQWKTNPNAIGGAKARGAGWDEESFGPTWSRFGGPEDNIISVRRAGGNKMRITCNHPTNFLPSTVHFIPRQDEASSYGGPIPTVPKELEVNYTANGAIAKFTSKSSGNTSYIHAKEMNGGVPKVSMTNADFFVGVRCFCPDLDLDMDLPKIYRAGDEIPVKVQTNPVDAIAYLPKNRRHFLTKESVVNYGTYASRNIMCEPSTDGIAPTVDADGSKNFKICEMGPEGTIVWKPIQFFFTHATRESTPLDIHSPSHEVFDEELHTDGEYYKYKDDNAASYIEHTPSIDAPFPCYSQQGNTVQTRGTWCISNAVLKAEFPKELPVVKSNISGKPRALKGQDSLTVIDLQLDEMMPKIDKIKKRATIRIDRGDQQQHGIRG